LSTAPGQAQAGDARDHEHPALWQTRREIMRLNKAITGPATSRPQASVEKSSMFVSVNVLGLAMGGSRP
jgi:hypothetical protein